MCTYGDEIIDETIELEIENQSLKDQLDSMVLAYECEERHATELQRKLDELITQLESINDEYILPELDALLLDYRRGPMRYTPGVRINNLTPEQVRNFWLDAGFIDGRRNARGLMRSGLPQRGPHIDTNEET